MEFCPTCGNMLLYEMPNMGLRARFYCPAYPYACQIESKVKIKRHLRLVKKSIDPIFSEDDRKNLNKTAASCPECGHGEATFTQVQIRSAEPNVDTHGPRTRVSLHLDLAKHSFTFTF